MNNEEKIIRCAAEVYEADAEAISLNTNIREELSNKSLLMIAFVSSLEDELNVAIELRDAAKLLTIADFVDKVNSLLS